MNKINQLGAIAFTTLVTSCVKAPLPESKVTKTETPSSVAKVLDEEEYKPEYIRFTPNQIKEIKKGLHAHCLKILQSIKDNNYIGIQIFQNNPYLHRITFEDKPEITVIVAATYDIDQDLFLSGITIESDNPHMDPAQKNTFEAFIKQTDKTLHEIIRRVRNGDAPFEEEKKKLVASTE